MLFNFWITVYVQGTIIGIFEMATNQSPCCLPWVFLPQFYEHLNSLEWWTDLSYTGAVPTVHALLRQQPSQTHCKARWCGCLMNSCASVPAGWSAGVGCDKSPTKRLGDVSRLGECGGENWVKEGRLEDGLGPGGGQGRQQRLLPNPTHTPPTQRALYRSPWLCASLILQSANSLRPLGSTWHKGTDIPLPQGNVWLLL